MTKCTPTCDAEKEVLREALVRTGKWSPTVGGYLVCMICCNGVRCECDRGEHIPREDCPNCLGKSGSIFANTSPSAALEVVDWLNPVRADAVAPGEEK
jgi:hypothetical protein